MQAIDYEVFSVALYLLVLLLIILKWPQKGYLSIIIAAPFFFLSEWVIIGVIEDSPARHFVLHYEYSSDFGMLYSIPWMLPFSNGWFWGIPLLISHKRYLISERKWGKIEVDSFRKINGKDMIEKKKIFEKVFYRIRKEKEMAEKIEAGFVFVAFFIWDSLVEHFATQHGLWVYHPLFHMHTNVDFPFVEPFVAGLAGMSSYLLNQFEVKNWILNVVMRIIGYNCIFLLSALPLALYSQLFSGI